MLDVTAVTTLVPVVRDVIGELRLDVKFLATLLRALAEGESGGGSGGDVGLLIVSHQGTGEPGGVLGGEYEGRRTVTSFGMGPGFRLFGSLEEFRPAPTLFPSETDKERFIPFELDEFAPTISMSASSTIIRLSILNGLPVNGKKKW